MAGEKQRRRGRPPTGQALTAAERMQRYRARQRAAGLRPHVRWQPAASAPMSPGLLGHRIIEARSLAMHCLIAQKIAADPGLLEAPRRNIAAWRSRYGEAPPPALDEWQEILKRPWEFGYYAQAVAPDTATLPRGWQRRLIRVENANTGGYAGLCLEVHDLAISKYVAGREKDLEFTRELARHGMTRKTVLHGRLKTTTLDSTLARVVRGRVERDHHGGKAKGERRKSEGPSRKDG
jgi:hypothetical protein